MTPAARERRRVRVPLLVGGAIAWAALVVQATTAAPMNDTAGSASMGAMAGPSMSEIAVGPLITGGALMVVAMMVPMLGPPTLHVLASSLARRRARAVAAFLLGYLGLWIVAGAVMMALPEVLGTEPALTVLVAVLLVAIWQASPAKQRCLNRLHAHASLPAFGPAADLAAVRFGLAHAWWCIGACWALMLLAVVVPVWSVAAMALVTLWLAGERLDRPERPSWRLRVPAKAVRLVLAQARIALRGRLGRHDEEAPRLAAAGVQRHSPTTA